MAKYMKKPIVVDAIRFTGDTETIREFVNMETNINFELDKNGDCIAALIPTLEGTMKANLNDFIIKGIAGEFYPCKPEIFHDSYIIVT